ncbi:MAG: DUF3256 family protein [Bacteroidaceae bacterium]|nr:DUF3256 family protein [Bacteroidaceae bacterium]
MKKFIITLTMLAAIIGKATAQDMRKLFIEMPAQMTPLMTENDRRDCIDFVDAGMRASITNRLDGKSELKVITKDYLHLQTSQSSSMQIKLLPHTPSGNSIICIINTVCAEACDSRISFYNKQWEKLPCEEIYTKPTIKDFFINTDSVCKYIKIADIHLVKLTLSATSDSLSAEYTMPSYMNKEDSVAIAPTLRTLHYKWDGNKFKQ